MLSNIFKKNTFFSFYFVFVSSSCLFSFLVLKVCMYACFSSYIYKSTMIYKWDNKNNCIHSITFISIIFSTSFLFFYHYMFLNEIDLSFFESLFFSCRGWVLCSITTVHCTQIWFYFIEFPRSDNKFVHTNIADSKFQSKNARTLSIPFYRWSRHLICCCFWSNVKIFT